MVKMSPNYKKIKMAKPFKNDKTSQNYKKHQKW